MFGVLHTAFLLALVSGVAWLAWLAWTFDRD
jgi:hypothetical protein